MLINTKLIKNIFRITVSIVILVTFAYFHPINETMSCDSNYLCKIEHNYFNLFKKTSSFKLFPNSTISNIEKPRPFSKIASSRMYLIYDNNAPFIYYYKEEGYQKYYDYLFNLEKERFEQYIKNPVNGYIVSSSANKDSLIMFLVLFIFVLLPLFIKFYLDNYFEKKK